jgi:hypothetical protein
MRPGERVCVAYSGGVASAALLHLLQVSPVLWIRIRIRVISRIQIQRWEFHPAEAWICPCCGFLIINLCAGSFFYKRKRTYCNPRGGSPLPTQPLEKNMDEASHF